MPLKRYSCVFEMCSVVIIYASLTPRGSESGSPMEKVLKKHRAWRDPSLACGEWSQVKAFGLDMPCSFRNRSRIPSLLLAIHPVHEIASGSSSPWEFGRGQSLLRLCGKTEVIWEIVSGWNRDMHGTICSFSHPLQLHMETQKVQVIHTA